MNELIPLMVIVPLMAALLISAFSNSSQISDKTTFFPGKWSNASANSFQSGNS